jgi:hypothetical protein
MLQHNRLEVAEAAIKLIKSGEDVTPPTTANPLNLLIIRLPDSTKIITGSQRTMTLAANALTDCLASRSPMTHPKFSREEVLESPYFKEQDVISIKVQDGEWTGINGLARLVLLHAMAAQDPSIDEANGVQIISCSAASCLLDQCVYLDMSTPGHDLSIEAST